MSAPGFTVADEDAGVRLDAALVAHGAAPSRAQARRLIEAGAVSVDGEARRPSHRIAPGQRVAIAEVVEDTPCRPDEPPAPFSVVFEDEHLMVVDKPAGVVVHPGAGHAHGTLVQALAGRAAGGPDRDRPGIVHRLDRDTSGLLIVAKSDAAHAALSALLRERRVRREYLALVEGHLDARAGTVDAAIGRDRAQRTVMSTRTDRGRHAVTHFEVVEVLPATSLLRVWLETGRTHQIRAHLAAIGHPVCGDARYGGGAAGRRLVLLRQFLHAARLVFDHPCTREHLVCESKAPADLRRSLDVARREQVSGGPDGD